MKLLRKLIVKIKIGYYLLLEYFDKEEEIVIDYDIPAIQRQQSNSKLAVGVRKLIRRLREMNPVERTQHENLLGMEPYKKSVKEHLEELRAREKALKNPLLKTEDDLVHSVVRRAPIYEKEQRVKEVRKAITACLRAAQQDPTNPSHTQEAKALRAKLRLLRGEIERMKQNG